MDEIGVQEFLNALVSYFDPEGGMAARDRYLDGILRDESAWPFLSDDLPVLAAALSGVVGVSRSVDVDKLISSLLNATERGDDAREATEREILASLCVKSERQADVLSLLETLDSADRIMLVMYLQEARRYEAQQGAGVSYELYKPQLPRLSMGMYRPYRRGETR